MLRFRLLGPFEAFRGDERIPATAFKTQQARCALKLLISEHATGPVPFVRLADTFWPDADPLTARNSLQVAVRTLRRVLEPDLARGSASRYIVTSGEAYRFVPNDAVIDVDSFLAHRQDGISAQRSGRPRAAIDSYRAAMAAYRGEYVAEEPDAEWVLGARERLREGYVDVAERLAALLVGEGMVTDAVSVLERALVADPLREELYLKLMGIHAGAGRRGHALAVAERCRRVLRSSLGVEPGPALLRLRGDIASAVTATSVREGPAPIAATAFVGRERELATLREVWARSAEEPGHLVVLPGDAGIGKTRLARHFAEHIGPEGEILWLEALGSERDLALAPILRSFASWLEAGATTRALERLGPHGPALAHLLPQVRAIWPDCPAAPPPGDGQMLEALTAAVLMRAGQKRALVALDDAQWADRETLRWLAYGMRRFPPGVLVVAIVRPGEGRVAELDLIGSDARRRDRLHQVDLGPLSATDVERILDAATEGAPHDAELSRRLHAATRGNPLFVIETIRELPRAAIAGGESVPVAPSVREAVLARLHALPDPARAVIGVMAVAGAPTSARHVAQVAGRPIEEVIDALDVLLARRLIRVGDDPQSYAIEHPLVSRVVFDALGPARRHEHDRRLAELVITGETGERVSAFGRVGGV